MLVLWCVYPYDDGHFTRITRTLSTLRAKIFHVKHSPNRDTARFGLLSSGKEPGKIMSAGATPGPDEMFVDAGDVLKEDEGTPWWRRLLAHEVVKRLDALKDDYARSGDPPDHSIEEP